MRIVQFIAVWYIVCYLMNKLVIFLRNRFCGEEMLAMAEQYGRDPIHFHLYANAVIPRWLKYMLHFNPCGLGTGVMSFIQNIFILKNPIRRTLYVLLIDEGVTLNVTRDNIESSYKKLKELNIIVEDIG